MVWGNYLCFSPVFLCVIFCRYKKRGCNVERQLSHALFLLLDLMHFFDHYHGKRIDVALDVC